MYSVVTVRLKNKAAVFETSCAYIVWCMGRLRKKEVAFETSCVYSYIVKYGSPKEEISTFQNVVCVLCGVRFT